MSSYTYGRSCCAQARDASLTLWRCSVRFVWLLQACRCAVCGDPVPYGQAIGHHVRNRCDRRFGNSTKRERKGRTHVLRDHPLNCEVRHRLCESVCHKEFPEGNVPLQWRDAVRVHCLVLRQRGVRRISRYPLTLPITVAT